MSWRLRLLNGVLRRAVKPRLARVTEPLRERRGFERSARFFRRPPFACFLRDRVGDVPGRWVSVRAPGHIPDRSVLLYLHGGAHLIGSSRTHGALVARISALTGLRAFVPDYRLAPEHPFPASLEDARAVWDGLVARGYPPERIVLGGDSSGGGLMLSLLAEVLRDGARPAAAFAFSPWVDLTLSGASFSGNAARDPLLPRSQAELVRDFFLAGQDPADPRCSPLFADFPDPPPVFLQAAETEILRDDTLRMAERLWSLGGEVHLDLCGDLPHVWPIFQGCLPEADAALERLAEWLTGVGAAPYRA